MNDRAAKEWAAYELALEAMSHDIIYQGALPNEREESLMRLAIRCYADPGIVRLRMLNAKEKQAYLPAPPGVMPGTTMPYRTAEDRARDGEL